MTGELREFVRQRSGDRCEYCRLMQAQSVFVTFQVEHIRAKQHGGDDSEGNLAWACTRCNLHKGPNLTGIDVETGELAVLFNLRQDAWDEHFRNEGPVIVGLTPIGRATVQVLNMNEERRVLLREMLIAIGEME